MHAPKKPRAPKLPVPADWQPNVKSAVLHILSLARFAMAWTRGWAADCPNERIRLKSELDERDQLIAWLMEELSIKDTRWSRLPNRKRPHYDPPDRMRILQLRAIRGWTVAETARRFHVTEMTIQNWMSRLDEQGPNALVQIPVPVNKFPDLIGYTVRTLKAVCPFLKPVKIAGMLARAGLHIAPSTVRRMIRPRPKRRPAAPELATAGFRTAKVPNGLWHVDVTIVPSTGGLWTSWLPFTLPQVWPFCWHVAIAVDHFSRRIMGFEVFKGQPTSQQMTDFLDQAMKTNGVKPKRILTDKGRQFWLCRHWMRWSKGLQIKPGFGALKVAGGICVVERAIRTFKNECCRRLAIIPGSKHGFRVEMAWFQEWFNQWRPSEGLDGATPDEWYFGQRPAYTMPRWEPRKQWKRGSPCAGTNTLIKGKPGAKVELDVEFLGGRKHLPIVRLNRAA